MPATTLDLEAAEAVVLRIESEYGNDLAFRRFQGPTASPEDLRGITQARWPVWLGSHLHHHWDVTAVASEVVVRSAQRNAQELRSFANALPALATPHGRSIGWSPELGRELGAEVVFIAAGGQNRSAEGRVLDRLELEPEPSGERDWWWSMHRRRLFGRLAS
jgi:hypothetical protein